MHRIVALLVLATSLAFLPLAPAVAQNAEPSFPTLTVTGQGEVSVTPDELRISFAVISQAETVGDAMSDNSQRARRVIDALKRRGLNEEDIQTTNFSISPRYSNKRSGDQPPPIIGYQVTNQVRVRTGDLESAGDLIEAGVDAGANSVSGLRFTVEDEDAVYEEAVAHAASDARRKATALATAAGVRIVRIVSIDLEPSFPQFGGGQLRSMVTFDGASPPIEPGQVQTQARVRIVYQISEG